MEGLTRISSSRRNALAPSCGSSTASTWPRSSRAWTASPSTPRAGRNRTADRSGRHLGLLTRRQVADLLKRTDVFLDASTYQAFGRTALEAMACGATATVPRIGGAAEFARHEENALTADTLDPEAVSTALDHLVEDPGLHATLQAAAADDAGRRSVLSAALSEYALFARLDAESRP